ncbi:hypothetical protein VPH35_091399 [Triticum aestivum]|uniref:RNase H type-1 domain-containing protein n=1 Tax=Triticum turgidum subsp. durum TaxID=4567 RepID=A0A9R1ANX6_TRITD|nr:unnamed protein product [Triticum turgidum subsp. durum]
MILCNDRGEIIFSACRALYSCREALEAELCACMEGLSLAIQRSELPIELELDAQVAMSMIICEGTNRSVYAALVKEIRHLLSLRRTCITLVSRSQNKASDSLATFGRGQGRTMTWLGSGPPETLVISHDDCNPVTFE